MGKSASVYIPCEKGRICGRNGTWDLTAVRVLGGKEFVFIDGIGKRNLPIRGGLWFEAEVMDELARKWLAARSENG